MRGSGEERAREGEEGGRERGVDVGCKKEVKPSKNVKGLVSFEKESRGAPKEAMERDHRRYWTWHSRDAETSVSGGCGG